MARLPPALAQAAGLRDLSLFGCDQLELTDADVDWLLAACPNLRRIDLDNAPSVDGEAAACLQAALLERSQAAAGGSG